MPAIVISELELSWHTDIREQAGLYRWSTGWAVAWGRGFEAMWRGERWTEANTGSDGVEFFDSKAAVDAYLDDLFLKINGRSYL